MTLRAVVLGLLLALLISLSTYFNDWVIGQTQLIGNHLPISIFGLAAFLMLVVSPVLRLVGKGLPFKAGEIAIITALGLVACGWPGSNFYRGFTTASALPAHWYKTKANWQSANVLSYVPGASAELGQGHVQDWKALLRALAGARASEAPSPARQVWSLLDAKGQRNFSDASSASSIDASKAAELTAALNQVLHQRALYSRAAFAKVSLPTEAQRLVETPPLRLPDDQVVLRNRLLLSAALPNVILPPPPGQGVLFDHGRADPFALDTLLQGRGKSSPLGLRELPWARWWPTILLWGGAAMLLSIAALCMALIVHPQWSKRELLPYPVARFIEEAAERKEGAFLPKVAQSKLFWLGFVTMCVWHLINGLHAWFDAIPEIPRNFDFWAMAAVLPNAVRVWGSWGYFGPTLYVSVVAFAFFMSSSVSFSLGIAQPLLFAIGAFLLNYGIQLDSGLIEGKPLNMLRFGAFSAAMLIIGYTGRTYYASVLKSALGGKAAGDIPRYATWACRGLLLSIVLAVAVIRSAGLSLGLAAAFVLLELVMFLGMTRAVTETGAFFIQASWAPVGVLTALFGFDAIGPTAYVVLGVASVILFIDSRELLMPFVSNALKLTDRPGGAPPARIAPWMVLVLITGFFVAGAITLYFQYNKSVIQAGNAWGSENLPALAFDPLAQNIADAAARGTLATATSMQGLGSFSLVRSVDNAVLWLTLGLVLALGSAVARLRLPWWPLHPVAFMVWGTYPIVMFGPSFLLGWLVKAGVIGTTGAKGYHTLKPLMVGIIAGELLSGLMWMIVGATYYFVNQKAPVMYNIFPG